MNADQAEGLWEQVKGRAKRAWGELTDDDFLKAEGSVDKLYGVIQEKVGDTKEAIRAKLEADQDKVDGVTDAMREQLEDVGHGDGKWLKAKGRAKRAWGELTENESLKAEGTADQLQGDLREDLDEAEAAVKAAIERTKPD